jgi:biopolymer transport protein ExbD
MLVPLIDILTIMVVFLISSYNMSDLVPTKAMELPLSFSDNPAENSLKVSVSKEDIRVDDKLVVPVQDGKVHSSFKENLLIVPLYENLGMHSSRREELMKKNPELGKQFTDHVIVIADKDTPASLIDEVLYTISQRNFPKFQLLVSKKAHTESAPASVTK